ncbi:MAG: sugar transferase [Clostridia bacterium]|nr:sugar transferase [Clostridia bacterium]
MEVINVSKKAGLIVKRIIDLITSVFGLGLLSPFFLLIAMAIKIDSPGPVFYRQERIGKNGVPFRVFKFRSMVVGADKMGLGLAVAKDDPRITRVGKWLRRYSLDELPQLINVVRGEMSIVGPRPTIRQQVEQYDAFQRRRLNMKPGITGWAQVNGRNSISWEERIELDVWYVDHWSLWLDAKIMALTIPKLLTSSSEELYGRDGVTPDLGDPQSNSGPPLCG